MKYYAPLKYRKPSLKVSISFSQTLCIKQTCSETSEVIRRSEDLKDTFLKRNSLPELLDYHFEKLMHVNQNKFSQTN